MKKIVLSALTLVLLAFVVTSCSCEGEKKKTFREAHLPEVEMELSQQDTSEVRNKTIEFLELLKAKNVDAAIQMLYFYTTDGQIVPLPDSLAKQQRFVLNRFPCLNYEIEQIRFHTETDTEVKYNIEFFEKEPGDTRNNKTAFFLRPMRRDGVWYLTLWNTNTDNTAGSIFKN